MWITSSMNLLLTLFISLDLFFTYLQMTLEYSGYNPVLKYCKYLLQICRLSFGLEFLMLSCHIYQYFH